MKISKEKLKQIIKEEMELLGQEQTVDTRGEFAASLKNLSQKILQATNIDSAEIILINSILDIILKKAADDDSRAILKQLQTLVSKKLSE